MAKLLSPEEIEKSLTILNTWEKVPSPQIQIRREFVFANFSSALVFINKVGELAEGMDHHPDVFLHNYKYVTLTLTTHSAGGLTRLDFDLAARIDKAFLDATGEAS